MTLDYAKELAEEVAANVGIRYSKFVVLSEEDYAYLKKCVHAEVLLALSGQISVDGSTD